MIESVKLFCSTRLPFWRWERRREKKKNLSPCCFSRLSTHSSPLFSLIVQKGHFTTPPPHPPPTPPPPPTEAININTLRMSPPTHLLLDRTNDKELYEYTHISAMLGQQCGTTHVAPHFRCTAHNAGGGGMLSLRPFDARCRRLEGMGDIFILNAQIFRIVGKGTLLIV